jgi:hypothetical protein
MGNVGRTLFITFLLFGTVIIGILYLRPAWQDFQILRQKLEKLEDLSKELDDLIANKDALFGKMSAIPKKDLDRFDAAIPRGPKAADYIVGLEAIAIKNGVYIKSASLQTQIVLSGAAAKSSGQPHPTGGTSASLPQSKINELSFRIQISASYDNLRSFLKDIEKYLRISDVKLLSFDTSSLKSENDPFDTELIIITYYQ